MCCLRLRQFVRYVLRVSASLVVLFFSISKAYADLNAVDFYQRCYQRFTGSFLPFNDPVIESLQSATFAQAQEACWALVEPVSFGSDGILVTAGLSSQQIDIRRGVVKFIDKLHRQEFTAHDDFGTLASVGCQATTGDLVDIYEPSLHFTRAFFQPATNINSVFQDTAIMEALRDNGVANQMTTLPANSPLTNLQPFQFIQAPVSHACIEAGGLGAACSNLVIPAGMTNNPFVSQGDIIGVRPLNSSTYSSSPSKFDLTVRPTLWTSTDIADTGGNIRINELLLNGGTRGGGILASQSFVALNFGHEPRIQMDGLLRMPRRLTQVIFQKFLCKEGIPSRSSDTAQFADPSNSNLPMFRRNTTCVGCHVSYDWAAAVYRNHEMQYAHGECISNQESDTLHMGTWQSNVAASTPTSNPYWPWSLSDTSYFYRRPPDGRLFFRSIDSSVGNGGLVNEPVTSLTDLGQKLLQYPDFYVCTASHYLEYLTGLKANLSDEIDFAMEHPTPKDIALREFVIDRGLAFMSHRNLKQLMRDIVFSPYFQRE